MKDAKDAKKKIVKANKISEELKSCIEDRKREEIKRLLDEGEAVNLAKRFQSIIDEARTLLDLMDLEDAIIKAMKTAVEANDEEAFEEQIEKAKTAGCDQRVFDEADTLKETLAKRKALAGKIAEALEADEQDRDLIEALVAEAKDMGIGSHSKVQQAEQVLHREKMLKETKKALKK